MTWFLNVHYALRLYDIGSIDAMLHTAVGQMSSDSGAGFGIRDISFAFDTRSEAETALDKLQATGLPFAFEAEVDDLP